MIIIMTRPLITHTSHCTRQDLESFDKITSMVLGLYQGLMYIRSESVYTAFTGTYIFPYEFALIHVTKLMGFDKNIYGVWNGKFAKPKALKN